MGGRRGLYTTRKQVSIKHSCHITFEIVILIRVSLYYICLYLFILFYFTLYIYHSKQPQHCYLFVIKKYKNHASYKINCNLSTKLEKLEKGDPQLLDKTNEH